MKEKNKSFKEKKEKNIVNNNEHIRLNNINENKDLLDKKDLNSSNSQYTNNLPFIYKIFGLLFFVGLLFIIRIIFFKKLNLSKINSYQQQIPENKISIAFVFSTLYGNGIGRMLSSLLNELVKLDKYNIYLLLNGIYKHDFPIDPKVKRVIIHSNDSLIEKFDNETKIDYYVVHNVIYENKINWYKNLNNKRKFVIGIMHGAYLASVYTGSIGIYQLMKNMNCFDAYISVVQDDYYVYKKLNINNSFFIPNLYTFEQNTTPDSNLTYNNLLIMGRLNDKIKGAIYAIKAMSLIVKEVPDAKLYLISSDYRVESLKNLTKELNLTKNIEIVSYVSDISKYFLNTSIVLYPSLSEAFPGVMNEAKAHAVPIIGFNVSYSFPYQNGIKTVEMLNYTSMAKEAIKLLKNYKERRELGLKGKMSLNLLSNNDTIDKWDKLFSILNKNDTESFKILQKYINEKYYDENKARERLKSNYEFGKKYNKDFECHEFENLLNIRYINSIKECVQKNLN